MADIEESQQPEVQADEQPAAAEESNEAPPAESQEEQAPAEESAPADTEDASEQPADAADGSPPQTGEASNGETAAELVEGGEPTADGEQAPVDGEQTAEDEAAPAPAEGDEAAPVAEGEGDKPAEGGEEEPAAPEGETEGDGEKPAEDGEPKEGDDEGAPKPEGEEGEKPAAEGEAQVEGEGQAEGEAPVEGETPPDGEAPAEGEVPAEGGAPEGEAEEGKPAPDGVAGDTIVEEDEPAEDEAKSPVPQSDTFAEGEKPESPMAIGEKLSREGSPLEMDQADMPPALEPGTPERYDSDEEGDEKTVRVEDIIEEDEEDMEPEFDRDLLIEKYHAAIAEREQLQQQNYQLQHKLADYFRKKKSDDTRQEVDKNVTDQEQRYLKYMSNLEDLRRQDTDFREDYKRQIEDLKDKCADRKEKVDFESDQFIHFKRTVATNAINSRSGKPIPQKDIDTYLLNEMKKEAEVVGVRLENIKLKNKLKKKELQLKSKEELAEGLHLIDFEQLKIENQTYNEKIEERNEELLKLRRKITGTVQVLTHLKEKLQFVQGENGVQKSKLRDVEELVAKKRDILSRTKQARDALRIDNQKLRQNCGLLGNEPLLRDFEERKDEGDDLNRKLDELKMFHAELTLHCTGVRRKIDQARAETA